MTEPHIENEALVVRPQKRMSYSIPFANTDRETIQFIENSIKIAINLLYPHWVPQFIINKTATVHRSDEYRTEGSGVVLTQSRLDVSMRRNPFVSFENFIQMMQDKIEVFSPYIDLTASFKSYE